MSDNNFSNKNIIDDNSNNLSSNDSIKNIEDSKFISDFNSILEVFWSEKVWKINCSRVYYHKIYKIIFDAQKLKSKINKSNKSNKSNDDKIFNIDNNFNFFISDDCEDLQQSYDAIINDNAMFIKTHSECFINFNKLQYNYFYIKNKTKLPEFILLTQSVNIPNYYKHEQLNIDKHYLIDDKYDLNDFKNFIDFDESKTDIMIHELHKTLSCNKNYINTAIKLSINSKKKIIIIDGENILKCFKIQHILQKLLDKNIFNDYFNVWFNGSYLETDDISQSNLSLSEYSSNVRFLEPYSSLSMDVHTKFSLLKIIVEYLFQEYICIIICNSKTITNNINELFSMNNSVLIPICYEKKDIREKDDHLIVFLYYYFSQKNIEFYLLSGDKFKWMTFINDSNPIKNIKFLFDFDDYNIKYVLSNAYNNDFIKKNNIVSHLSINYFPIPIEFNNMFLKENYKKNNIDDFIFLLENFFVKNCFNNKEDLKKNDFCIILNNIFNFIEKWCDDFSPIFNFLKNYTKNEIFKLLKKINQNTFKYNNIDFERFRLKINEYKQICNLYVIIKHISININLNISNDIHIFIVKIFSKIIATYDSISSHIFKIRKLSNNKQPITLFFMELNSMFIYIKKIGIFKKQI